MVFWWREQCHYLIDMIYPIAFIFEFFWTLFWTFELLIFVIVWTQGPFVGFMDLNLNFKSLWVVGPQCTIVELKNTMSGTFFGQQFTGWLCQIFDTRYDFDNLQIF